MRMRIRDNLCVTMLILAIDTALDACAVAVLDSEANYVIAQESQSMVRGHAEALMPLLERVRKAADVPYIKLDRIAVTTGPGSFTGLRVGLSAARGLALAANKPVVGVTTLSVYAAPLVAENGSAPIISVIDARHDQAYMQVVTASGGALVRPRLTPIQDIPSAARFGTPRLVGNAAQLVADRWPSEKSPVEVRQQPSPDISWVAWLGATLGPNTAPARPTYLRAPDAKPQTSALSNNATRTSAV